MGTADIKTELRERIDVLNRAAKAYYSDDEEIMSNLEYDRLYDELEAMEKETGIILSGSPTQRVGYEVLSELPKERHPSRMLSLDKTKDRDELAEWLGDRKGILSWKLDGLTVVLSYEGGRLTKAVTRGNGEIGEVITSNARTFVNLPIEIAYKGDLMLRGEAVITYADFEEINSKISEVEARYKNPRNLCAGSVRQLSNKITAERKVRFYAFSLVSAEDVDFGFSRENQMKWLKANGFDTVEYSIVNGKNVIGAVADFEKTVESNPLPSDGLVLTYDDIKYSESLGTTAKFPRDAIAFKWRDQIAQTVLREIEWSASRTGLINPVAIFDPVELEGTTVSRASLHNISIMEELKLAVGDTIEVYKANMIIPQVASNLTESGPDSVPEKCPVCGTETIIKDENGVKTLNCPNRDCPAKRIKSFTLLVSRDALDIGGLSEMTLEKFVDIGIVKTPADIFRLHEHRDEIVKLEGFGDKSFDNLAESIENARRTTPDRLLLALGVAGIGVANAKVIARACKSSWKKMRSLTEEELTEIEGIGGIMAKAYTGFFSDEANKSLIDDLVSELEIDEAFEESGNAFDGLTFVITGSLLHFENRNALKAEIEKAGGKVAGSVSGSTSYLINNDVTSGSGKNKKAKELGIEIIDEATIIEWLQKGGIK